MPNHHLPNLFQNFDNLHQISAADIALHLKSSLPAVVIENYFANRQLFPHAIPTTIQESQLELAILAAIVSHNRGFFYNLALHKITIPPEYQLVYQDLNQLIQTVITSVNLEGQATVIIPNPTGRNTTGWAIAISSSTDIAINYNNQQLKLSPGQLLHLPPAPVKTISINQKEYSLNPGELGCILFD